MKKSDLKQLRENIQKAAAPQSKKKEDLSDELSDLFDDGTELSDEKQIPVTGVADVKDPAPQRDFTRVANSLIRDAIPAGLFTGKGKQLYDYLYTHTRGAIVPVHSARIPTRRVMKGAGMTRHTYRAHLQRLVTSGLVQMEEKTGEQGGNIFTVFLPEEVGLNGGDRGDRGDYSDSGQKLPLVLLSEVDRSDRGLNIGEQKTYATPKTSFKTNTKNDDDIGVLSDAARLLVEASVRLTGQAPNEGERKQWTEVIRIIVAELDEAASRAGTVSNVPAFLSAHLRRKFSRKPTTRRGETTPSADVIESPVPASAADENRRLTAEDVDTYTATAGDLIREGRTVEEVEAQFASSLHPDDWTAIRDQLSQRTAKE
jgi:hypothetical protein